MDQFECINAEEAHVKMQLERRSWWISMIRRVLRWATPQVRSHLTNDTLGAFMR